MIGERFYANFMDVLGDTGRFDARLDFVRCGSVTVGASTSVPMCAFAGANSAPTTSTYH